MVDDTAQFRGIIRDCYRSATDLEEDVRKFQLATATAFYKSAVLTRKQYERRYGKELPEEYAYYYVQFRCVHSRRTNVVGKRYRDYDCKARFSFALKGMWYQLGEHNLVHSHEFDVSKPWLYAGNRRLTNAEEIQVCDLMSTFNNTQLVRQYVASQYGRHLNRSDLWAIKRRHMNRQSDEVLEETTSSEQNDICRPKPEPTAAELPVDMPDAANVTAEEKNDVHYSALDDQAIKLRTAEQVMAKVTTQLCSLDDVNYQQMLQSFKLLGELISAEIEVNLYCKTRHSTEPLPLNNTGDLLRLKGIWSQTLVPREKTQDGVLLPSSSKNKAVVNGGSSSNSSCFPNSTDQVRPKNPEAVNKRKAPLVQRITDIPASAAVPAGIKFPAKYRGRNHSQRRVATSSAALQNDACGVCSQADDPKEQCASVSWVLCDVCGSWFHQSCAGFQGEESFICTFCTT